MRGLRTWCGREWGAFRELPARGTHLGGGHPKIHVCESEAHHGHGGRALFF